MERPEEDSPFRVAILGDFSGRANRRATPQAKLRDRKPIAVDLDNFDDVRFAEKAYDAVQFS